MFFSSKNIKTSDSFMIGTIWKFRNCQVEMFSEGFHCNCKKKPRFKCEHIKSVEMGILGVNCKQYRI